MRKLNDLKNLILSLNLGIKAENLEVKADTGKVIAFRDKSDAKNKNFSIIYDIDILILDFNKNLEQLIFYINDWIFQNSENYENGDFTYKTDIINNSTYNLILQIKDVQEDFYFNSDTNTLNATTIDLDKTDQFINSKNKNGYIAVDV